MGMRKQGKYRERIVHLGNLWVHEEKRRREVRSLFSWLHKNVTWGRCISCKFLTWEFWTMPIQQTLIFENRHILRCYNLYYFIHIQVWTTGGTHRHHCVKHQRLNACFVYKALFTFTCNKVNLHEIKFEASEATILKFCSRNSPIALEWENSPTHIHMHVCKHACTHREQDSHPLTPTPTSSQLLHPLAALCSLFEGPMGHSRVWSSWANRTMLQPSHATFHI